MRLFQRRNTGFIIILMGIFGLFAIKGCDGEKDRVSGIFYVSGKEIRTIYSAWPIPEGEEPSRDTTDIGFIIKIQKNWLADDRLRIVGLEGADAGKYDNRVYPDCTIPQECKIYGKLTGEDLEIEIENNGRSYRATGNIYQTYDPYLEMTATYNYQNVKIQYELEGGRMRLWSASVSKSIAR